MGYKNRVSRVGDPTYHLGPRPKVPPITTTTAISASLVLGLAAPALGRRGFGCTVHPLVCLQDSVSHRPGVEARHV